MVLPWLRPVGEPVHVVPGPTRAGHDVRREAERMLAVRRVDARQRVPALDVHVVAPDEVEDVRGKQAVDEGAALARDRHEPPAARHRVDGPDEPGAPVVDALARPVDRVGGIDRRRVARPGAADDAVGPRAPDELVVPGAALDGIRAWAAPPGGRARPRP